MSAVESVRNNMERLVPEPGEDQGSLARRMFYLQMEIYSAHAMTNLYKEGDFELLPVENQRGWLESAARKLKKRNAEKK